MGTRGAGRRGPQRLVVDWPRCDAHGLCAELLPELVTLDEWGYPVVADGPVPEGLRREAVRARDACPAVALRLQPLTGAAPVSPPDPSSAPTRDDPER
jgi:ferredoxin